jgi:hypothetical protein
MTSPVRTQSPLRAPRPAPSRPGSGRPEPRHTPQVTPVRSRRPDLRVVEPSRRRLRTAPILCGAGVLVFAALLASAVFYSVLVSGQDNLDRMNTSISSEQAALQRAKLALARAQSPGRIAEAARQRGMVPADHQTWVTPNSGAAPVVTGDVTTGPAAAGDTGTDVSTTTTPNDSNATDTSNTGPDVTANGAAR